MARKPAPDVTIKDLLQAGSGLHAFTTPTELNALIDATPDAATTPTNPTPNPLDGIHYTGDTRTDTKTELTTLQKTFRAHHEVENQRRRDATDTGYWVAIYFRTSEEKNNYLDEFGLKAIGTKYLDGHRVTRTLRRLINRPTNTQSNTLH